MSDSPNTIQELGFLSDAVANAAAAFRLQHAPWTALYFDVARSGRRILNGALYKTNKFSLILAYTAIIRACTSFETHFLLVERGIDPEAKTGLRTICELAFVISAIQKDPTFAKSYIIKDEASRQKFRKNTLRIFEEKAASQGADYLSPEHVKEMQAEIDRIDAQFAGNQEFTLVNIRKVAEKAGLLDIYQQQWSFYCNYAHPAASGLSDYMIMDAEGYLRGFKLDVILDDSLFNLRTAIVMFLRILLMANELFGLDFKAPLDSHAQASKALMDQLPV